MQSQWPFGHLTPLKYGAIIADNPWPTVMRSEKGHQRTPETHYDTMSIDDIAALPVADLASKDCLLFMWTTWHHLRQAIGVMDAWGFEYVTGGDWVKRTKNWKLSMGLGYILRNSSEPYIVGKIGNPKIWSRAERNTLPTPCVTRAALEIPDTIDALRREHSRKPPQMREMVERLLPQSFNVELFAREPWPGHDTWGNETTKFAEASS